MLTSPDSSACPIMLAIIVAYRANGTVHACVRSLLAQTTSVLFEVIPVESSGHGSAEALQEMYPEIRVLKSDNRLNPGEGRNLAITVSRGQILAFLDADCTVKSYWISAIAHVHTGSNRLVFAGVLARCAGELAGYLWLHEGQGKDREKHGQKAVTDSAQ